MTLDGSIFAAAKGMTLNGTTLLVAFDLARLTWFPKNLSALPEFSKALKREKFDGMLLEALVLAVPLNETDDGTVLDTIRVVVRTNETIGVADALPEATDGAKLLIEAARRLFEAHVEVHAPVVLRPRSVRGGGK